MGPKFINLFLFLILTVVQATGQNFEGKIMYEVKYKSKIPNVSDGQFAAMMGATQEYIIKNGNYKSTTNGTILQWQLYIHKDNKLYMKMSNSAAILYNEGSVNPDEVLKAELNKSAVNILGHDCDELVLTCKSGLQKYYFSSVLQVDPKLFENHKYGNWNEYLSRAGALPLKAVIETPQFVMECTAVDIRPMALEDKLFELPAGSKVEKSPF